MRDKLRIFLIALCLLCGIVLVYVGWLPSGSLLGLGLMIIGINLILFSLYLYNRKYK